MGERLRMASASGICEDISVFGLVIPCVCLRVQASVCVYTIIHVCCQRNERRVASIILHFFA